MKKKLIIGFVVVILLISLLPFPQNIERTYYGVNAENGEKVDIVLDMKYLSQLLSLIAKTKESDLQWQS